MHTDSLFCFSVILSSILSSQSSLILSVLYFSLFTYIRHSSPCRSPLLLLTQLLELYIRVTALLFQVWLFFLLSLPGEKFRRFISFFFFVLRIALYTLICSLFLSRSHFPVGVCAALFLCLSHFFFIAVLLRSTCCYWVVVILLDTLFHTLSLSLSRGVCAEVSQCFIICVLHFLLSPSLPPPPLRFCRATSIASPLRPFPPRLVGAPFFPI